VPDEYHLTFKASAAKEFRSLLPQMKQRIGEAVEQLREVPRPAGVVKLQGKADLYRIRVGDYRIVYEIDDKAESIKIMKVRHRREVYRDE
jgi:mRNA interferase RelE/StbE